MPKPLTDAECTKLADLHSKSTPGRWRSNLAYRCVMWGGIARGEQFWGNHTVVDAPEFELEYETKHNLRFITAAHNKMPRLLATVEDLRKQVADLQAEVERLTSFSVM